MNILHELMKEVFMIEKEQNYDSLSKDLKVDPSLLDDYRSHNVIIINEPDINYTEIYKSSPDNTILEVFDIKINGITYVFKNVHQITEVQNLKKFMFMYLDDIITMSISGFSFKAFSKFSFEYIFALILKAFFLVLL